MPAGSATPSGAAPPAGVLSGRQAHQAALIPEIADGASIKIIGLGGVGGIVARFGAVFLASLDRDLRLVLIDGDSFEPANAGRMLYGSYGNKASVLRDELCESHGDSRLNVTAIEEYVSAENLCRLLRSGDIVILAVDNHATRKLVADHCAALPEVCLISGGNDGIETRPDGSSLRGTYGNCQITVRRDGTDLSPSLDRFHPEIRRPADRPPAELHCTELAASVPQILFANLMAAASILNALWLHLCGRLTYSELCFDVADGLMRPVLPFPMAPGNSSPDGEH